MGVIVSEGEYGTGAGERIGNHAMTGAKWGSLGGPVGTFIGGAAGGLHELIQILYEKLVGEGDSPEVAAAKANAEGRKYDSQFVATPAQLAAGDLGSGRAMSAGLDQQAQGLGAALATGQNQSQLVTALQGRADGTAGPSLAELQLTGATDRNAAQAASLVASQRGLNPGAGARMALNAQTDANQAAVGQAAILRAQEQQGAQALLAQTLSGQRGQDLQTSQQGAGLFATGSSLAGTLRGQDLQNQQETQRINAATEAGNADRAAGVNRTQIAADQNEQARNDKQQAALAQGAAAALAQKSTQVDDSHDLNDVPDSPDGDYTIDGFSTGGAVPGKPRVARDSPTNDTVPAKLSPGEIVLPLSIVNAEDAPERAAEFVAAILRQRKGKGAPVALSVGDDEAAEGEAQAFSRGGPVKAPPARGEHWIDRLGALASVLQGNPARA